MWIYYDKRIVKIERKVEFLITIKKSNYEFNESKDCIIFGRIIGIKVWKNIHLYSLM